MRSPENWPDVDNYRILSFRSRLTTEEEIHVIFHLSGGRILRYDVMQDGRLESGDICIARVDSKDRGGHHAMLDINGTKAYLPLRGRGANRLHRIGSRREGKLSSGDLVLVMVDAQAYRNKPIRAGALLRLGARHCFLSEEFEGVRFSKQLSDGARRKLTEVVSAFLKPGYGYLFRSNAEDADTDEIMEDLRFLQIQYLELTEKYIHAIPPCGCVCPSLRGQIEAVLAVEEQPKALWYTEDPALYRELCASYPHIAGQIRLYGEHVPMKVLYKLESLLDRITGSLVHLRSGAELVIENTEAFTVIDVNSSGAVANAREDDYFLKINREAADEIVYQMGVRRMAGIILVDLISMKDKEKEQQLFREFQEKLSHLRPPAKLEDITKLGLAEISRKRENADIREEAALLKRILNH